MRRSAGAIWSSAPRRPPPARLRLRRSRGRPGSIAVGRRRARAMPQRRGRASAGVEDGAGVSRRKRLGGVAPGDTPRLRGRGGGQRQGPQGGLRARGDGGDRGGAPGGGGGAEVSRRDAIWAEKRRRALERRLGKDGPASDPFAVMAPPPDFEDRAHGSGVDRGGGAQGRGAGYEGAAMAPYCGDEGPPMQRDREGVLAVASAGDGGADSRWPGEQRGRRVDGMGELDQLDRNFDQGGRNGRGGGGEGRAGRGGAVGVESAGSVGAAAGYPGAADPLAAAMGATSGRDDAARRKQEYAADLKAWRPKPEPGPVCGGSSLCEGEPTQPPPPPFPRTKWTRRVPYPVLIGHVASLIPY